MIGRLHDLIRSIESPGYGGGDGGAPGPGGERPLPEPEREPVNPAGPGERRRHRRKSPRYSDYPGDDPVYDHGGEPGEGAFETAVRLGLIAPVMGNQSL